VHSQIVIDIVILKNKIRGLQKATKPIRIISLAKFKAQIYEY
jgi:hypothetical protein